MASRKAKGLPALSPKQGLETLLRDLPPELQAPDPESPRGRILEAARQLFAAQGFGSTSTRAIAQAAGANLAMIHYYFGSKERLYRRVMALEVLAFYRRFAAGLDATSQPEQQLVRAPITVMRIHQQQPTILKLLLREMADGAPHLEAIVTELGMHGPHGLRRVMGEVIRAGQTRGRLRRHRPELVMALALTIGNGLQAFRPLLRAALGVDLARGETASAVETMVARMFEHAILIEEDA